MKYLIIALMLSASAMATTSDVVDCSTDEKVCETSKDKQCLALQSSNKMVCMTSGEREYCQDNTDCPSISRPKCMDTASSSKAFTGSTGGSEYGFCAMGNVTNESNPMGAAACNLMKIVTGQIGRILVATAIIVLGIMFFLGKIPWTTVLAVALGAGAIFGAPVIVGLLTGQKLDCSK